jgi:two-component system, sensor histidine kinase PdtaS
MSSGTRGDCKELGLSRVREIRNETTRSRQVRETPDDIAKRYAILLREGDHRIKNSLQIVSSLLSLQASREENPHAREALRSAAGRVQSVARMHDALQAGEGEDSVDLGAVLENMCGSLQAMGGAALGVEVRVETQPCHAPVAIARSVGLAINELVVNALRHAFPDGRPGSILVKLTCDEGRLCVLVADDGVGLPADHAKGRGYGMKLVRMMVGQINGVLYVDTDDGAGTRITIVLPEPGLAQNQSRRSPPR